MAGCSAVVPDWSARPRYGKPGKPSISAWSSPWRFATTDRWVGEQQARTVTVFAVIRFPPREGFAPCQLVINVPGVDRERSYVFQPGETSATFRANWVAGQQRVHVSVQGCPLELEPRTVRFTVYEALNPLRAADVTGVD
jgi:hypothetical protein